MPSGTRTIVRFSDLDDARAALAAIPPGRPLLLASSPDAAGRLGAPYLIEVARLALGGRGEAVVAIDCGADVGAALVAIEAGAEAILIESHPALADFARARGVKVIFTDRLGTETGPIT